MRLTIDSNIVMNDGNEIPRLGLGVYQTPSGEVTERAVTTALEAGYRHVDTARLYGNEESVGRAVREGPVAREEVFVVTKLWNSDHGARRARAAFEESRQALGLEVVDLFLIHWPVDGLRDDSWRVLQELKEEGLCRSIGVSNYTISHLEGLLSWCEIPPTVNQVEFSPFLYQEELLEVCREQDIVLEAYSPLTKGARLNDETLVRIGSAHGKSPAQVLVRWALQHDVVVIPKSARPEHIRENADVFDFELTAEEMAELDALDDGLRTSWDPTDQP
ncbi:MAG: aldo/keto reductase [bacterium]